MGRLRSTYLLLLLFCIMMLTAPAAAAEKMAVAVNQSRVLNFFAVERVAVANPDIADVMVVSGSEILLVGKAPGVTTLHVWSASGLESYEVEVATDDTSATNEIKSILGLRNINVSKIGKTIILEGKVSDQYQKNRAEAVAASYADKVVNLLEITSPKQVKIEAKVVEIDRTKSRQLGIAWGNTVTAPSVFSFGQSVQNSILGRSLGKLGSIADINGELDALIKNGSARILSQPNVITLNGDKANIMVGGQIPVPVSLQNGTISIEWKDYGIKLDIEPEVNVDGLINSKIKAEVSSLDWDSAKSIKLGNNMEIPPLKVSRAETAIALSSGQTMAIGGLISSQDTKNITKLPLLADIPVLGNLFKSSSFNRNETELLIFITPSIVDPSEYLPEATREMKDFVNERPWGGSNDDGKNKGVNR